MAPWEGIIVFSRGKIGVAFLWPKINRFAWGEKTLLKGVIVEFVTGSGPSCIHWKPKSTVKTALF